MTGRETIETIAIIGAGELGREIAGLALRAGHKVVLEDLSVSLLEQAVAAIRKTFDEDVRGEGTDATDRVPAISRLSAAHSVEDAVREADLIVETVADDLEMKLELFTIFDKFAKPGAIFASTTEILSLDDLADITFCPHRCLGLRFQKAGREARLRLVRGRATSDSTIEACRELGRRMNLQVAELHSEPALPAAGD